jgi:hypothetical protein
VLIHPKPCRFDLTWLRVPSCSIYPREGHLRSCQWLLQFRSSYSNERCQPQHWNLRQFFSTQSIRWSCHTERVKWWTQHDRTLQWALSPMHGRKSYMGNHDDHLLDYPGILWSSRPMHHSLLSCAPPPFVNLGMRFLLWGKGCTFHISETLIKVIKK